MSDTHGMIKEVTRLVELAKADRVFHCGDFCVNEHAMPFKQMVLVRGNNDIQANVPYDRTFEWMGLRIFMTHGHRYKVNQSLLNLMYKAKEEEADVVLFGHTHHPVCIEQDGLIIVNPGSLKSPRGYSVPTLVLWKIEEIEQGLELSFTFYDAVKRKAIPSLSRTFQIK